MKYLKTHNEFIKENFLSNLLNRVKTLLTKENNIIVKDILNKIKREKDLNKCISLFEKNADYNYQKIDNIENVNDLNEHIKLNLILIDSILREMSEKFGIDKFKPNILYSESSNNVLKEIFSSENTDEFLKYLDSKMDALKNILGKEINTKVIEEIPTKIEEIPTENTEETTEETKTKENDEELINYKKECEKFLSNVYKTLFKKLENIIKNNDNQIDGIVDNMSGTQNTNTKKNILNTVINSDKNELSKVRDTLNLDKTENPL